MIPLHMFIFLVANDTLPNVTSITGLFQWANTVTGGFVGIIIDVVVFLILLFGSIIAEADIEVAGLVSSFICIWLTVALAIPKPPLINILFILPFAAGAVLCYLLIWTKGATRPYG
jgi:hypothetical protein